MVALTHKQEGFLLYSESTEDYKAFFILIVVQ